MVRSAIQLYTLRDLDIPFTDLLYRIADAGFDGIEYAYRVSEADTDDVSSVLEDTGLRVPSAHVPVSALKGDLDEIVGTYRKLRCEQLVVPYLDDENFKSIPATRETARQLEALADRLAEYNYTLCYHNHDVEFAIEFDDGQTPFDILVAETDAIGFELDVGLAAYAGAEPAEVLRNHATRVELLHYTDTHAGAPNPAHTSYGTGDVDFRSVSNAAINAEVRWYIYENGSQEDPVHELEHATETFLQQRY